MRCIQSQELKNEEKHHFPEKKKLNEYAKINEAKWTLFPFVAFTRTRFQNLYI